MRECDNALNILKTAESYAIIILLLPWMENVSICKAMLLAQDNCTPIVTKPVNWWNLTEAHCISTCDTPGKPHFVLQVV